MLIGILCSWPDPVIAQGGYKTPTKEILDLLTVPASSRASISPRRDVVLFYSPVLYAPLSTVQRPFLGLAGVRIDVGSNGLHNPVQFENLVLEEAGGGPQKPVILPWGLSVSQPFWAPDGQHLAFTHSTDSATELWVADAHSGTARVIGGLKLNGILGDPCEWLPGRGSLLCRIVPKDRGPVPQTQMPPSPHIEEGTGKGTVQPTYQDLLKDAHDADLFEYYATSQICIVDITKNTISTIGKPAIFHSAVSAPDGKYILVEKIHRPYSYMVRENDFPRAIEIWDRAGRVAYHLADLPLEDSLPVGGVSSGPREAGWVAFDPATLVWTEALDGGNPKNKVPERDRLMWLKAPFKEAPQELTRTENRLAGLYWGQAGNLALLLELDRERMRWRSWFLNPANPNDKRMGWDLNVQDRYHQPGEPLMCKLESNHDAICEDSHFIFFVGPGYSPQGACPFLDKFDLTTLQATREFRCDSNSYEPVAGLLSSDGLTFLTRRETPTDPPNYYVHGANGLVKQLTSFSDPAPSLRMIDKKLVTYKRRDGVELSMSVYLPPDYKPGERRPAVLWAYPLEFTDASLASQTLAAPNRFTTITGISELFFALHGYVVLDDVSMPVVGTPEKANDTFVDQIAENAQAAVDKASEMAFIDPDRIGVGGASYGAFMTANLLAHTQLFKAGVALSGAYDRTLTPFGFQHERRTLWEARETYFNISPIIYADKIKVPLLLVHGEADNNPGTLPIQSEMMYRAIRGNGGTARLVLLPGEGHGYSARESVAHALYEMMAWFDKYVKNAPHNSISVPSF